MKTLLKILGKFAIAVAFPILIGVNSALSLLEFSLLLMRDVTLGSIPRFRTSPVFEAISASTLYGSVVAASLLS